LKNQGLCFVKCDLHMHTPASHDYQDKLITPEDFVKSVIAKGIKVIAITDHNSGAFIDKAKEAAKGKGLIILPGVEISCSGGKNGIHVIALFDIDKDEKTINALLTEAKIKPEQYGAKDAFSKVSIQEIVDIIGEMGGLPVLAHCTSSKGVLNELAGINRTKVFESPYLLAVESSVADYENEEKKKIHKRAYDVLDGTDPNYNSRELAVYSVSDSHSLASIGENYSYFKVDPKDICLESFRQSFIDREVRILQSTEYDEYSVPYIKTVSIDSGFFDGETAEFHSGLNTIIGSKGSGKSLLIELIRFGLDNNPIDQSVLTDHKSKLELKLKQFGKVNIELIDESGSSSISRTFDFDNSSYNSEDEELTVKTFPVLFLSQNEIIRIAEDPNKQLKFIDSFFDFRRFTIRISKIKKELEGLDRQFTQCLSARNGVFDAKSSLTAYQAQLKKIEKQVASPEYKKFRRMETTNQAIMSLQNIQNRISEDFNAFYKKVTSSYNITINSSIKNVPEFKRINAAITDIKEKAGQGLAEIVDEIEKETKKTVPEFEQWTRKFGKEKIEYSSFIGKHGGQQQLETERAELAKLIDDMRKKLDEEKEIADLTTSVNDERLAKLEELEQVYVEYLEERKKKCKTFEIASGDKLKIELRESSNNDIFKETLLNMKKGSYLRESDINSICSNYSAKEFVFNILRYFVSQEEKKQKYVQEVAQTCSIGNDTVKKLFDFLISENTMETLLKLQYDARAQDSPDISVRIGDKFQSIQNVSVGQKCNAMLIIALSDGRYPVIIDQPEDSLDIRSIWDDICLRVRNNKAYRQFIFTTHNSSLAVASDTDKYLIVECDDGHGMITNTGAIDSKDIKGDVVNYLEGGETTYENKYRKYGFNIK